MSDYPQPNAPMKNNSQAYKKPSLVQHGDVTRIVRSGTGLMQDDWFLRTKIPPVHQD